MCRVLIQWNVQSEHVDSHQWNVQSEHVDSVGETGARSLNERSEDSVQYAR